jgi:hypothetical protein
MRPYRLFIVPFHEKRPFQEEDFLKASPTVLILTRLSTGGDINWVGGFLLWTAMANPMHPFATDWESSYKS